MDLKQKTIDEALLNYIESENNKLIEQYKDVYNNYNVLCRLFPEIMEGIGKKLVESRANDGTIEFRSNGRYTEYSLYSIAKYKTNIELFKKYYVDLENALITMGYKGKFKSNSGVHFRRFYELHQQGYISLILINHEIYKKKKVFIERKSLEKFLIDYYNFEEAAEKINVELSTLKQYWLPKYGRDVINIFHTYPMLCYVKKEDWDQFAKEKVKQNIMSKEKACKILDITADKFMQVVSDYNISGEKFKFNIESTTYYSEEIIENLKNIQKEMIKEYETNYYTGKEVGELLNVSPDKLSQKSYKKKIKTVTPPALIFVNGGRFNLRKSGYLNLYLKSDVDALKIEKDYKETFHTILYEVVDSPINIFNQLINFTKIEFSEYSIETKKYWMKYVEKKLIETRASDSSIRAEIYVYFKTQEYLINLTSSREIFYYSSNELELSVFNSLNTDIAKNIKIEMYKFLGSVYESRVAKNQVIKYKRQNLPNVYRGNSDKNDKDIYSIEEYVELFNFVKEIKNDKVLIINDAIKQFQSDKKKSNHYDSVWLYTILHLNNAWRHYDVTLFPRVSLKNTRLENLPPEIALDWLKEQDLNQEEIAILINRVKSLPFFHSKTKKKRYFFCSDNLKGVFALSLVICELRTQIVAPFSETIIAFDNMRRNLKYKHKNAFFGRMETKFDFKSKKMNRTIISLIYSIVKKNTGRNPVEITKYIRSHSNVETTNIYIDIPQDQIDFITQNLFDLGNFGFAYDALSQILIDDIKEENRERQTEIMLSIKKIFGDVYQIEGLVAYLNRLSKERIGVLDYIKSQPEEYQQELMQNLKLGQQPAKVEGYQCLFSSCRYPAVECKKCVFAVLHFNNLSQLGNDFKDFLNEYKENYDKTLHEGEKIRLSNILYSYLMIIEQAINRFGKDDVCAFFEGGLSAVKEKLSQLTSSKHLVTISELKGENDA